MKNKHPNAIVVLALGFAMAGLHLAGLLLWSDAETGFATAGSVWLRYIPWLAALVTSGVAMGPVAKYAVQYPEMFSTGYPTWAVWADLLLPVLCGAWLLYYGGRAFKGFGMQRQKLGSPLFAGTVPLYFLWKLIWRFQFTPASVYRMPCALRVLSAAAALLFAVVLIKVFLVPGLPCGHTLYAAGTGAYLLCTGLELTQTLFEAAHNMLTLPDLAAGLGIGLLGLCGLFCAWEACGKEME